jgi:hypothetical protein
MHVVVYGLGHADHGDAGMRAQLRQDAHGAVATDHDQRVDADLADAGGELVGTVANAAVGHAVVQRIAATD